MTCPTSLSLELMAVDIKDRASLYSLAKIIRATTFIGLTAKAKQVCNQALSVLKFETEKATPAKLWADAKLTHAEVYKRLRVDPSDEAAFYACFPFRLAKVGDKHRVLAPVKPPLIATKDYDWTHVEIETVLAWNPVENTVEVMGDKHPQLIMPEQIDDVVNVYGDPFLFFRAWVDQRAAFWQRRRDSVQEKWMTPATEPADGGLPGILCIGEPDKIKWPVAALPRVVNAIGIDHKKLNSAIFKAAALPRVVDGNQYIRAAA